MIPGAVLFAAFLVLGAAIFVESGGLRALPLALIGLFLPIIQICSAIIFWVALVLAALGACVWLAERGNEFGDRVVRRLGGYLQDVGRDVLEVPHSPDAKVQHPDITVAEHDSLAGPPVKLFGSLPPSFTWPELPVGTPSDQSVVGSESSDDNSPSLVYRGYFAIPDEKGFDEKKPFKILRPAGLSRSAGISLDEMLASMSDSEAGENASHLTEAEKGLALVDSGVVRQDESVPVGTEDSLEPTAVDSLQEPAATPGPPSLVDEEDLDLKSFEEMFPARGRLADLEAHNKSVADARAQRQKTRLQRKEKVRAEAQRKSAMLAAAEEEKKLAEAREKEAREAEAAEAEKRAAEAREADERENAQLAEQLEAAMREGEGSHDSAPAPQATQEQKAVQVPVAIAAPLPPAGTSVPFNMQQPSGPLPYFPPSYFLPPPPSTISWGTSAGSVPSSQGTHQQQPGQGPIITDDDAANMDLDEVLGAFVDGLDQDAMDFVQEDTVVLPAPAQIPAQIPAPAPAPAQIPIPTAPTGLVNAPSFSRPVADLPKLPSQNDQTKQYGLAQAAPGFSDIPIPSSFDRLTTLLSTIPSLEDQAKQHDLARDAPGVSDSPVPSEVDESEIQADGSLKWGDEEHSNDDSSDEKEDDDIPQPSTDPVQSLPLQTFTDPEQSSQPQTSTNQEQSSQPQNTQPPALPTAPLNQTTSQSTGSALQTAPPAHSTATLTDEDDEYEDRGIKRRTPDDRRTYDAPEWKKALPRKRWARSTKGAEDTPTPVDIEIWDTTTDVCKLVDEMILLEDDDSDRPLYLEDISQWINEKWYKFPKTMDALNTALEESDDYDDILHDCQYLLEKLPEIWSESSRITNAHGKCLVMFWKLKLHSRDPKINIKDRFVKMCENWTLDFNEWAYRKELYLFMLETIAVFKLLLVDFMGAKNHMDTLQVFSEQEEAMFGTTHFDDIGQAMYETFPATWEVWGETYDVGLYKMDKDVAEGMEATQGYVANVVQWIDHVDKTDEWTG